MFTRKLFSGWRLFCVVSLLTLLGVSISAFIALSAGGHWEKDLSGTLTTVEAAPTVPGQWVSIGPNHIIGPEVGEMGQYNAVGRLMTMAINPTNPQIIYVGSPGVNGTEGCGVWKTTDGGDSWIPIADNLPNIAVDVIALDPTNPDRVYIVIFREGMYRSDDAGGHWIKIHDGDLHARTNLGPDGNRTVLLINPLHPNVMYLTTDDGVMRSQDGGQIWKVSLGGGGATSLVMEPQEQDVLYAAISGPAGPGFDPGLYRTMGIYKTIHGGNGWEPQTQFPLPFGTMPWRNILLAIS